MFMFQVGIIIDFDVVYFDLDIGDMIICEIFSGNDNLYFEILFLMCVLLLVKNYDIDISLFLIYFLIVKVVDSKGFFVIIFVNIEVLDINDNVL